MRKSCSDFRSVFFKAFCVLFITAIWLSFVSPLLNTANAAEVTLAWDANSEDNLAGYKLYYKTGTGGAPYDGTGLTEGDSPITIYLANLTDPASPTFTLTGLADGTTYYFALTAFDTDGLESDYSDEVSYETSEGTSETSEVTSHTITTSVTGQGAISPGGTVSVSNGTSQTFTIEADAHHHIAGVAVDGASVGQVGTYTFENVTASYTISAVFEIDTFTVTATAGENGSISPRGVTSAAYGTSLSYTITPADGCHISDVLVDGWSAGPVTAYTFENISIRHTIAAAFEADGGGIVDVNPGGEEGDASEAPTDGSEVPTGGEPTDSGTSNTQVDGNRAPETPVALLDMIQAPAVGPVELGIGGFSDPDSGDFHTKTEWRAYRVEDEVCIFSISSTSSLTAFCVPAIMLDENSSYYWQARVFDNENAASGWSEAAQFTTGFSDTDGDGDGIPDSQEVDDSVDLNHDDLPDAEQEIVKSIALPLSNLAIGLGIENSETVLAILFMESVNADSIAISAKNKGRVPKLPLGLLNFKLAVEEPGDAATVTVYFPEQVHPQAQWMKLDMANGVWLDYSSHAQLSDDRMSMALKLVDGGFGDDDGVANGIIIDPGGLALGVAGEGSYTEVERVSTRLDNEFSGCFITGATVDNATGRPMAVAGILLLIGAAVVSANRRSNRA